MNVFEYLKVKRKETKSESVASVYTEVYRLICSLIKTEVEQKQSFVLSIWRWNQLLMGLKYCFLNWLCISIGHS